MNYIKATSLLLVLLICAACFGSSARAQTNQEETSSEESRVDSSAIARKLSSLDPLERQHAAEELARLAAVDQMKLVAGYRLQERDGRVRLALDWALYRMGRNETLFRIVRELDSSRHEQAAAYLAQLDTPDPLYIFLPQVNFKTQERLLEVFGKIGDAQTLERIRPLTGSPDEKIARAAQSASEEITRRLAEPRQELPTRARTTGITTPPN
ncbi:MAG TPA: hypothetical protein VK619_18715 [Pyrinomonadaceae bacterium]|nr:hypothetical protein [Pyrinomonadaceae bacterium]